MNKIKVSPCSSILLIIIYLHFANKFISDYSIRQCSHLKSTCIKLCKLAVPSLCELCTHPSTYPCPLVGCSDSTREQLSNLYHTFQQPAAALPRPLPAAPSIPILQPLFTNCTVVLIFHHYLNPLQLELHHVGFFIVLVTSTLVFSGPASKGMYCTNTSKTL